MKTSRIILSVAACIAISSAVHAETVTQKEARMLAEKFFNTAFGEVTKEPKLIWNGRQLTTDRLFSPFYVFNHDKGAYVIISGENKAYPILGYSLKRCFDRSALTEEENELLKQYAREIEVIRYDPREPTSAIAAWQKIPEYLSNILTTPYSGNEAFNRMDDEQKEFLEKLDRMGNQILMPSAVEFFLFDNRNFRDLNLDDVTELETEEEYIPFQFYDKFIEEVRRENAAKERNLELILSPDKPIVRGFGAGSYEIDFPEKIYLTRIYSLNGQQVAERYFKDSQKAFLNLEGEANGFYVAMALSESGKVYGFKLAR